MEEPTGSVVMIALALCPLALLAGASLRWAPADHLLVVSRRGTVRRVVGRGPTWCWPLLDRVEPVPLGGDPLAVSVRTRTRDGRPVRLLAEAVVPVVPPAPGEPADALADARAQAEADLADRLSRAAAACDVADLGDLAVGELAVVEVDVVLR